MAEAAPWDPPQQAEQPPWAPPAAADSDLTSMDKTPAERSALYTARELQSNDNPLIKYPLVAAGTVSTFAHGTVDMIKNFFQTGIHAAAGEPQTLEHEIGAGLVAAGMEGGGGFARPGRMAGLETLVDTAKQFQDGVIAPAAQRLDSYARVGDPNGVRLEPPLTGNSDFKLPDGTAWTAYGTSEKLRSQIAEWRDAAATSRDGDLLRKRAGAAQDYLDKFAVKPSPIRPVEGSPSGDVPTTVAAKTGIPEVDSVLHSPVTRAVIDNAVIDRQYDVPYMAGGSEKLNDPTVYIDKHVPREQEVDGITFDPAQPWSVHENVEQHTMEILTRNGMTDEEAYRVAHYEFAEPAEQAWYRAHGIDQEKAEAEQMKWLPRIQHENPENPPPNLYTKPYPHDHVQGAEHEAVTESPPTAEEKQRAFDIIRNAPELQPKSAQPMLQQARELGVIGPERPPVNQMTPKEAADAVVPPKPPSAVGSGGGQPKQSAWRQRLNTSLDRLGISSEAKALIDDVVDRNAEYQGVRQGDLRPAQIETMAEAFGMDPTDIDPIKTGLMVKTNAQLQNAVELMTTLNGKVEEIAKRIAEKEGADDADDIVELSKLRIQRRLIAENSVVPFIAVRAEGSRALTTVKNLYAAAEGNGIGQFLKDTEGMDTDDVRRLAREIATSPGSAARALGKMDNMKKDGPIYWMWKQGLISGWLTHTKYLAANTTYQAMERGAVTPIASVIGKVIGNEGDRVNMADALAGVSGLMNAIPDAFTQGKKAFRNNAIPALESEKKLYAAAVERNKELVAAGEAPEKIPTMLSRAIEQGDLPRPGPSSGVWGKYLPQPIIDQLAKLETPLSVPGRSAGFIHTIFRNLGEGATLAEEGSRKAAAEGLSPISQEYWDRVSYHMDNPDEKMLQNSVQDAWKGTFMSELGKGGKLIAGAIRQDPILKWIFPFTHIPVNLMKATLEYTPIAPLGKEWRDSLMGRNGGVAQQKALARVTIGSAIMTYFANKYMQGQATGEYPIDPKVRAQWKLEGKEPNSLLIGDYWYSVNKFGPFGDLAQIGANIGAVAHAYMESREQHDDIDVSLTKAAGLGVLAAAHLVSDEVGMLTLQNGFEVLSDQSPTHDKLTTFAGMQASSLIPFSSAISQTASVTDPYMRQIKGILGALEYRIPGARQMLPAKRDPLYGEPIANPQYGNIIRQRQANIDPVKMELDRLSQITGWKPAAPKNLVGKIKLTPEQYDRYEATAGPLVKQLLAKEVASQRYRNMTDDERVQDIKGAIAYARGQARSALQMDAPHLIKQGIDNRTRQITGVSTGATQ